MVLLLAVVLLAAVLVLHAASRPDSFRVARTVRIEAPPAAIFPLINDLKAFNTWNPFLKHDPAVRLTYEGPASGVGAAHEWDGNRHVGQGRVEIVESLPPARIAMKLTMTKPMQARHDVTFRLEPAGPATDVTWAMTGCSTFVSKLMGLFMSMDRMVGGAFARGLHDLKHKVEG